MTVTTLIVLNTFFTFLYNYIFLPTPEPCIALALLLPRILIIGIGAWPPEKKYISGGGLIDFHKGPSDTLKYVKRKGPKWGNSGKVDKKCPEI